MTELRPYQEEDVEHYRTHDSTGNFSEQRTGKTPPVCTILKEKQFRRVLIVCPASLCYMWRAELKRWAELNSEVADTTSFTPAKTGICIANYEKIRGDKNNQKFFNTILKWKPEAIVLDEAHRIKNRTSLTFTNLRKLRNCKFKIALTATPAFNKPWDVWAILNWLFPKVFSSYWNFIDEYFEKEITWVHGEPKESPLRFKPKADELLRMNLDIYCIQHKRKEVMEWIEDMEEPTIVKLKCTTEQRRAIDALTNYFEYKNICTKTILDNLIRIRQVCAAPKILALNSASPKTEWLVQYLKDYPEQSTLVFSNSKKFLYYISYALKKNNIQTSTISGDVAIDKRQGIVDAFQAGEIKVLLLQTQAAKEGLTLDKADVSIFLDTYPPASDYLQAKDRMVAVSEERNKPKEIIHVMMEDTYDEQLYTLVEQNISNTAIINDYKKYIGKE